MVQHYFASAWVLGGGVALTTYAHKIDNLYAAASVTALGDITWAEQDLGVRFCSLVRRKKRGTGDHWHQALS
jgi:hypothetical protein